MFKFKQFTVYDEFCAMKVGTDAVLLGAWADCDTAHRLLDIGTGTGIIALMLAQRSPASTIIDAIDIDEAAALQATKNVQLSTWNNRINVRHCSLQQFDTETARNSYDLIISNPPYFNHSLLSKSKQRNIARHNQELPFDTLLSRVFRLLCSEGKFYVILPYDQYPSFVQLAILQQLYLEKATCVSAYPHQKPKRILLAIRKTLGKPPKIIESSLTIYATQNDKKYSPEYYSLTKGFYL